MLKKTCGIFLLFICATSVLARFVAKAGSEDNVGFPEIEPVREQKNKDNRTPIYIPGRCPENELLYPGDQKDDWICDCVGGHLYYPPKDGCFPAFRKGPCNETQYLILPPGKVIPECVTNPCGRDKVVKYKGKCHKMGRNEELCKPLNIGDPAELGVNATTLELECVVPDYQLTIFQIPDKDCPLGSRRTASGQCRQEE